MKGKNYYTILGIDRNASMEDITQAYRQRVLARHPDHNIGDPTAEIDMQLIIKAAKTLRDPLKRAEYDRYIKDTRPSLYGNVEVREAQTNSATTYDWMAGDVEYDIQITREEAGLGTVYTTHFHNAQGQLYAVNV